jgi:hypothetical protein
LDDIRNFLFNSPEDLQANMQKYLKINASDWKIVVGQSWNKIMSYEDQGKLISHLLAHNFTEAQIELVSRFHKKVTGDRLYSGRKMLKQIKVDHAANLNFRIETGVKNVTLKKKGDKIERKVSWWRIADASLVVENWLNRDLERLRFHSSQPKDKIQLMLTGDHFGETYGFYISRLNTSAPNSPSNFLPLASIANSQDTGEIIFEIIKPVIENLTATNKMLLQFKKIKLPRNPPTFQNVTWDDIPTHNFATETESRGPSHLLCYQPGENENGAHPCKLCHRRFTAELDLKMHDSIDHEKISSRKTIADIHPDFEFYHFKGKKDGLPKSKELPSFDAFVLNVK